MSASAVVKKKHVRFASMEDDDDNDEQEEDTLFDKRKDTGRGLKSALKAVRRTAKPGCDDRVEVVGGGRSGSGACGRWVVTLALCASFLGLVCEREGGGGWCTETYGIKMSAVFLSQASS